MDTTRRALTATAMAATLLAGALGSAPALAQARKTGAMLGMVLEPLDYMQYGNPNYYWGYDSAAFNALAKKRAEAPRTQQDKLYGDIQRQLTQDAVNAWIFNPAQVAVARKGLKGLWASSPIFANDMAAVRWGD